MQKLRKIVATATLLTAWGQDGFSNRNTMQEPTARTPQVDCSISPVRGILTENDPQSRLVFTGTAIITKPDEFAQTPYSTNATTSFSLNNGLGWHGVGEGGSVTYIATDQMPTDTRFLLRYRLDQRRVMMMAEPDCDLSCDKSASLAIEISAEHPARMNSRNANAYVVSLGNYSNNERYCGFCISGNINEGPMQELQIVRNNSEDRVDLHFPLGRLGREVAQTQTIERCATFEMERVCITLQGFDRDRREAHVILRVETGCTIVAPQ